MKKLSSAALTAITVISLLLNVVFTYLWCTLSAPVSGVFAALLLVAAIIFLVCIFTFTEK